MTDNIKLPPYPEGLCLREDIEDYAREAVRLNAQAVPDGIPLNIIRKWPNGFDDRLQHVWLDVVSFIPSVKLYDLQRVLAEFGLRMEVYEDAPAAPQQKGARNG